MSVKIRLARRGRKKRPIYSIVVADSRSPRDGRFIEKLGVFNPNVHNTTQVTLNHDRALYWVLQGAQPTDTARTLLSKEGVMFRKHLQVGVNKGAITQETADQRYQEWVDSKLAKDQAFADSVAKAKADEEAKVAAEIKKIRDDEAKAEEEAKAKATAEALALAKAEEEAKAAAEAEAAAEEAPAEEASEEAAPEAEAPAEETEEKKDGE